jgi:hypothetical protein
MRVPFSWACAIVFEIASQGLLAAEQAIFTACFVVVGLQHGLLKFGSFDLVSLPCHDSSERMRLTSSGE